MIDPPANSSPGKNPIPAPAADAPVPAAPPPPEPPVRSVARSASIMAVATFLSRIAGLVREQAFAFFFGAGAWTDAFNVAFRIPNLLRDLFAEGAMSSAFVPTFNATLKQDGKERAFRLMRLALNALFVLVGLLTLIGIVFAPEIVQLLAPRFTDQPEKFAATVLMTRIMFPFLLIISWAAVAMGCLNSLGDFFLPAIAPVFFNLGLILAGFTLCPWASTLGYPSIVGMSVGALLGGLLQMAIQFPALWRHGFRFGLDWDRRDPGLRRIVNLIIPGTMGLAATQINVAISTILATSQGDGAVSWLNYAFRLMQLPLGIFGVAIAQATLPVISRQAASGERDEMRGTIAESLKLTGFVNITATFALIALADPIIRILFERGRFGPADTLATAQALQVYAVGLFFFSAIKVLGPAFYALNNASTPVRASIASVLSNIVLNVALIGSCGYWGLALGSSLAAVINAGILFYYLDHTLGGFREGIGAAFGRTLIVALAGAGVMRLVFPHARELVLNHGLSAGSRTLADMLGLSISVSAGLAVLFFIATLLGMPEAHRALEMLRRKLPGFSRDSR